MRFVLLDLLRVVAICLVVLSHTIPPFTDIIDFFGQNTDIGFVGVSIFIILSGLCLQLSSKKISLKCFFKKKILRIYPLFWSAWAFAVVVAVFLKMPFSLFDLGCSFFGVCGFVGNFFSPILIQGWFIGLIVSLYILFPLLSKAMKKHPFACLFLLFCISLTSKIVISQYVFIGHRSLDWFPLSRVFEFGLGIFLAIKVSSKTLACLNWLPGRKIIVFLGRHSFLIYLFHPTIILLLKAI